MSKDLQQVDPKWAWSPYEPSAQRPWTRELAAHLYRRGAFAATDAQLDEAYKLGPGASVRRLCEPPAPGRDFSATVAMLEERSVAGGDAQQLAATWLYRMLNTSDPLLEKLTLFWHGHFATSAAKVDKPRLLLQQNQLLRSHARGRFEELVRAISRDPAMLIYLDTTSNRRVHPNENYARELLELFTLGVGNYGEQDIKELARALTGWEVLGEKTEFNRSQHDTATKSFLGLSGNFGFEDSIRVVLDQPAAPKFIARKLVRFFVIDEPEVSDELIEPIAHQLRENNFCIEPAVRKILESNLFFSEFAVARKIKSPVDLAVGLLHALGASANLLKLAQSLIDLGQGLLFPPNVKGWPGGRAWINSSTLLARINLVGELVTSSEVEYGGDGESLASIAARAGAKDPDKIVNWLSQLLLAAPMPREAKSSLLQLASDEASGDRNLKIARVIHAMSALPEFQLA